MKKFLFVLWVLTLFPAFIFTGCEKEEPLLDYVTELRENVYEGELDGYHLKACYGFKRSKTESGAENKKYALTFTLTGNVTSAVEYSLCFNYDGVKYEDVFKYDISGERLYAEFFIVTFTAKEFDAVLNFSSEKREIKLSSTLPENTKTYKEILSALKEKQTAFIDGLYEDGVFRAEIILRVTVKNDKAYYYVGIVKDGYLKAFLMDGETGEVLAIREIR